MRRLIPLSIAIAAAAVVAYLPIFDNGFVRFDDDFLIYRNDAVLAGLTRESIQWAFTTFTAANWFPLTWLSWMLDFELFGGDARAVHTTNLVLHTLTSVLLFVFFARATGAIAASAFVAAVFALHPLHVESVAWASSRKDVLSGTFFALTLLAYERYARVGGSRGAYVAAFVALALGLMSKATLVVTPFVLLLLDVWPLRRAQRGRWTRRVVEKLPLFALVAASCVVTYAAQSSWGAVQSFESLPLGVRLENALFAYLSYVAKSLWPTGLAAFYPYRIGTSTLWQIGGAAALLVGGSLLVARRPPLAVGWFWFLGMLVPVIGLVQVGQAAMADRYSYLPQIGLSVAVTWGGIAAASRWRIPRAVVATLAVGALVGLGAATRAQVRVWKDTLTLWEHALRVTAPSHVAHISAATALLGEGRLEAAEEHLIAGLRLSPASWAGHGAMGDLRIRQERPRDAVRHYQIALEGGPEFLRAWQWHSGLAAAYAKLGRFEEAASSYRAALGIEPEVAQIHRNLAWVLLQLRDFDAAIRRAEEALQIDPELPKAHGYIGAAHFGLGRFERAIPHFERALTLDPDLAPIHAQLARALVRRGEPDRALEHFDRAVQIAADDAGLQAERAQLALRTGDDARAIDGLRSTLRLGPRRIVHLNNLAWLLATSEVPDLRNPAEAVTLAREAVEGSEGLDPAILDTLAIAQAASGDFVGAIASAERALAIIAGDPEGPPLDDIRQRLDHYRKRVERGRGGSE